MKMQKKGFTLVELAIVLVVIGLLLGMAFKGKSLVDAARTKAEMNKVQKMSTAINVYYAKYDSLPGTRGQVGTYPANSSAAVYQALINEGLLTENDFKASVGNTYWNFIGCGLDDTGAFAASSIADTNGLCIFRSTDIPTAQNTVATGLTNAKIAPQTVCQIETILDDKNTIGGDGRVLSGTIENGTGWDCADTTKYATTAADVGYVFKIF